MANLDLQVDQLSVKAGYDIQAASLPRNPSGRKFPVDERDPRKRPLPVGKHQGVQQIEKELRALRTTEQKLKENIRQRVHPASAHVSIDLLPRPAVGGVVKCRVLLASVHGVSPFMHRAFAVRRYFYLYLYRPPPTLTPL